MRKLSTMLGFVSHAAITVLGVIAIQSGIWSLGLVFIAYAAGNVVNELLLIKQHEVIAVLLTQMEAMKRVSNN